MNGLLGIVSDFLTGGENTPDCLQWVNAQTEGAHWHVQSEDRPFTSFSVTPRTGAKLRAAAEAGELKVRIECDGRRYEGTLPAVMALIPGRRPEEVWIMAHLYEPLADDNSVGVAAAIEAARLIMERGTPEFSVRLIFAMEMYGFAAYAHSRGGCLRGQVIGACNFDGMCMRYGNGVNFNEAGPGTPFFGNYLLKLLYNEVGGIAALGKVTYSHTGMYADDTFLGDPTVGVPTAWPIHTPTGYWHNSVQAELGFIDPEACRTTVALYATFVDALANPESDFLGEAVREAIGFLALERQNLTENPFGSDAERLRHRRMILARNLDDFKRFMPAEAVEAAVRQLDAVYDELSQGLSDHIPHGKWRDYAANMICRRLGSGFPYDQANVPRRERIALPDTVIYGHFANILSNMDGRKNIAQLIREAEYERGKALTDGQIKKILNACVHLAQYGYLELTNVAVITKAQIVETLNRAGIAPGDLLMVHAAASECGQIEGGPQTIIDALREAAGTQGTVLFPTFTRPYIYIGGLNKSYSYRPYNPADPEQIWVGLVPKTLLRNHPETRRSRHITHSWAGFGPLAAACLDGHGPHDPPAAANSPMGEALRHGGKILHFGNDIASTTFLHYFEDHFNLEFLAPAVCTDVGDRKVLIEKHLPGHRDFYRKDGENSKFFRRALAAGLRIEKEQLGLGEIKVMDIKQLFEIGSRLVEQDKRIFLCDDSECLFCREKQR